MLQTKWSGKNYSARIWTNTRKVATEIQSTILQAIHRGYSIQRLSKNLAQRMNVAYTNAERLILTELNAVENRASADAMRAADFEYYQFVATLDQRTCPICGERDGEVYPLSSMNQGENAPPMHPRCRCTIIAHMEGVGKGSRIAEGRTRISADVSYRQWLMKFDLQRFGTYEENKRIFVKHDFKNGITRVTKSKLIESPFAITEVATKRGGITRNFYDDSGRQYLQISNNDHGNVVESKYGRHGEHAHDYEYSEAGEILSRKSRELYDFERERNGDIL